MTVSIVIPTYNEGNFLEKPLQSLEKQTVKPKEIIIADYHSTDHTLSIAKKYGAKIVHVTEKGVGNARQLGAQAATGDIIATTDADTIVPNNWIERIISEYKANSHLVAFGGLFELYSGSKTAKLGTKYLAFPVFIMDRIFSHTWTLTGNNMSFLKSAFEKVGGYDTTLHISEDTNLSIRLSKIGAVKLDRHFKVFSSGRRYKNGYIRGQLDEAPNVIMRMLFKKVTFNKLKAVREEA